MNTHSSNPTGADKAPANLNLDPDKPRNFQPPPRNAPGTDRGVEQPHPQQQWPSNLSLPVFKSNP
jgi:hypothetical protein